MVGTDSPPKLCTAHSSPSLFIANHKINEVCPNLCPQQEESAEKSSENFNFQTFFYSFKPI